MSIHRTLITAAVIGVLAIANAEAAVSEPTDIGAEDLAKIARVRAQKNAIAGRNARNNGGDADGNDCGSIDIGNSTGNRRRGGKTDITVFVDGDVINAFNKCR